MTRVLYWNLMKFSQSKLYHPDTRTGARFGQPGWTAISKNMASAEREDYIHEHFNITDSAVPPNYFPPDFVVVVEVVSQVGPVGQLSTGKGPAGARHLLDWIRWKTSNPAYMMVPVVRTGPKESVAVFYNSAAYAFTGPWRWPGGAGPAFDPVAAPGTATGAYPPAYNTFVATAPVPAGAARNVGQAQDRLAPAGRLTYAATHALAGQDSYNTANERLPYWVTFAELNPAGGVARDLSLFAFHSPASAAAHNYLVRASQTAEIVTAPAPTEVKVVLGDFNLNLMTYAANMPLSTPYQNFLNAGFQLGIARPPGPPPAAAAWGSYFTTLTRSRRKAKWYGRPYPGYGYADRRQDDANHAKIKRTFWSIDNIMALYGAAAGGPIANTTILTGVVGSPFNLHPVVGAAPTGFYEFPNWMTSAIYQAPPALAPVGNNGHQQNFRTWINFGRVRNTSDHLALMADI